MNNPAILSLCVVLLASADVAASRAQTQEDLMRVVKSGVCPEDLTSYEAVKYSDHCAGMDERSCDLNDKACFDAASECWAQVNSMNKQIYSYNNFIKKCAAQSPPPSKDPSPSPSSPPSKNAPPKK
jgi:hypothetical protein